MEFKEAVIHLFRETPHPGESEVDFDERMTQAAELYDKIEAAGLTMEQWIIDNTPKPVKKELSLLDRLIIRSHL